MALPRESLYVLGMEMLTVRLSCSIDEFEGGSNPIERVDCWLVAHAHPPLEILDGDSNPVVARFSARCHASEIPAFAHFVDSLPWRFPAAVRLVRACEAEAALSIPG